MFSRTQSRNLNGGAERPAAERFNESVCDSTSESSKDTVSLWCSRYSYCYTWTSGPLLLEVKLSWSFVGFGCFALAAQWFSLWNRRRAKSAYRVFAQDERQPVVFLRSLSAENRLTAQPLLSGELSPRSPFLDNQRPIRPRGFLGLRVCARVFPISK